MKFGRLEIHMSQVDLWHCRVRSTEYIGVSGKILVESGVDQSHN